MADDSSCPTSNTWVSSSRAGDIFADVLKTFGAPAMLAARTNILCLVSATVLLPLCLLKVNKSLRFSLSLSALFVCVCFQCHHLRTPSCCVYCASKELTRQIVFCPHEASVR